MKTRPPHAPTVMESAKCWRNAPDARGAAKARRTGRPAASAAARASFDHWWNDERRRYCKFAGEQPDSIKAAITFEALRRRPEIQEAARAGVAPADWLPFTVAAVRLAALPWVKLGDDQRETLCARFYDPLHVPPRGFSNAPRDQQRREAASLVLLPVGTASARQAAALESCGWTVCAVNTKSARGIRAAAAALTRLGLTTSGANLRTTITSGTRETARGVRVALVADIEAEEPRRFHWLRVARELEESDRDGTPSDYMSRIRL